MQSDGKIIVVGQSDNDIAIVRYNSNGSLDTGFSGDGKVVTDFGAVEAVWGVAVLDNGKILVAGSSYSGSEKVFRFDESGFQMATTGDSNFLLVRYNSDGSLDTGFGNGGRVTTELGGIDVAMNLLVQDDGKIILTGTSDEDFAVVRYNADGSLDTTFGGAAQTHPVWQHYEIPAALVYAPGQYVSIDLTAQATDSDGDQVLYYGVTGYMAGSVFTRIPGTQNLPLTATGEGHLAGGFQMWNLAPAGNYLFRVYADDDTGDTIPGVYFDVPVTVNTVSGTSPFALVPDTNPSDDLLYTFNPGQMVVGRIYDQNDDLILDQLNMFYYWLDGGN